MRANILYIMYKDLINISELIVHIVKRGGKARLFMIGVETQKTILSKKSLFWLF